MATKTPKFLFVDDDLVMQSLYTKKFKSAGIDFFGLTDPDGDFVKKVADIAPGLILMDIRFIGHQKNGVIASEMLQLDERTKNIPIIFFTNGDIEELAQRAKKLTSSIGFLLKIKYIPSELVSKVQELYNTFLKNKKLNE